MKPEDAQLAIVKFDLRNVSIGQPPQQWMAIQITLRDPQGKEAAQPWLLLPDVVATAMLDVLRGGLGQLPPPIRPDESPVH